MISGKEIKDTVKFLKKIIAIRSLSGQEEQLIMVLKDELQPLCDSASLVEISPEIRNDPLYCNVKEDISYNKRHNLILKVKGSSNETVIINAHADVVPAAGNMFEPYENEGAVFGRGACDDKGQIASLYLLLKIIKKSGRAPVKSLEIHIVVEEEIGGNGTLAIMKEDFNACLAIIMEPTNLKILTGCRGAVWFKARTIGISGHSGEVKSVKNALLTAVELINVLKECHSRIFRQLKGVHPFEEFENPMPLTFGKLHSGDWPATAPKEALLEGVFGFLPGTTCSEITSDILKSIDGSDPEISGSTSIIFPLQRDPCVTSRELPCVMEFKNSVNLTGISAQFSALPACCDMWFYSCGKNIPSVIFGAGELRYAHSDNEHIKLADIKTCAESINNFINL